MHPDNKAFLESHYPMWERFKTSETIRGIGGYEIDMMEKIMGDEFQAGYKCQDKGCGPCILDMVKKLFTAYDKWLSEQPIIVKASFPLNEKS